MSSNYQNMNTFYVIITVNTVLQINYKRDTDLQNTIFQQFQGFKHKT